MGERKMIGWIVFILGTFDLAMGAYTQIGAWICLPIAAVWYIMILKSDRETRRKKMERKVLATRLQKLGAGE
jgi:hypothetical protein